MLSIPQIEATVKRGQRIPYLAGRAWLKEKATVRPAHRS